LLLGKQVIQYGLHYIKSTIQIATRGREGFNDLQYSVIMK